MRRHLPFVAIVGPDGAGKTTIAKALEGTLPLPAKYLYMGWNFEASNVLLPTNRLLVSFRRNGAPGTTFRSHRSTSALRRLGAVPKLANLVAEGWYRQIVANRWRQAGYLVIFDRHFAADFSEGRDERGGSWPRRMRHAILRRALPKPGIVIYLDAPAEVLLGRKGEGTLESLQRQRNAYRAVVAHHGRALEIPADRDLAIVTEEVRTAIMNLLGPRANRG